MSHKKNERKMHMVWKRCFMLLPTVFLISLVSFFLIFQSPGELARLILEARRHVHEVPDEDVAVFAKETGLNASAPEMYVLWLKGVVQGDFGKSLITKEPVLDLIGRAVPKTLGLTLIAFFFQVLIGFWFAFVGAWRPRGWADVFGDYWSVLSVSVPPYWLALLVLWVCTACLKWTFVLGYHGFISLLVPGFVIGLLGTGGMIRLMKSKIQLILQETYIEYAIAQGVSKYRLLFGHVLKNAFPPILSYMTMTLVGLFGGSVFIEKIFSIPGIGTLAFQALENKDIFLLSGVVFYVSVIASVLNLVSDLLCMKWDRRSENELYQG